MALDFSSPSARVVYSNIGNLNTGTKSILLDFYMPSSTLQANNDLFSATRNAGSDTFQNFILQLSDEGGTVNSIRSAHFGSATGQAYTASNVLSAGHWNRIVWTCSNCAAPSPLNTKIYVNSISLPILGGSLGNNLGSTAGDICIGNRAHLDRGVNGQIARFAIVNRIADEDEIQKFEDGLKPTDIFAEADLLLAPSTDFQENWHSHLGGTSNMATLSSVVHVVDPTYGISMVASSMSALSQNSYIENDSGPLPGALNGVSKLPKYIQVSHAENQQSTLTVQVVGSFDGATVSEELSTISVSSNQTEVYLVPRKFAYRDTTRDWLTIQARVNNVDGSSVKKFKVSESDFDLNQNFTLDTKLWWRPVSGTKDDWTLFDNNLLENGVITSYNSTPFGVSDILVGDQPGYYYNDIVSDVSDWLLSPYVTNPHGADENGVISTLTNIQDENGRSSGSLNQYAIRISDTQPPIHPSLNAKIKLLIFANIHSGEMVAKWAVKGLVEWLIGNDINASDVRKNFEIYIVWVNSTGLYLGHPVGSEFTGLNADKNLNRDWGDFELEATRKVRDWASGIDPRDLRFVIDFHNLTWSSSDKIFRDPTPISISFCDSVDLHYSNSITQQNNTASSGFTTFYYKNQYNVEGATLEPRRGTNSIAVYEQFGQAVARGLNTMLANEAFGRFGEATNELHPPLNSMEATTQARLKTSVSSICFW